MQAGVLYKPRDGEWKMDVFHDIGAAMRRINELAPDLVRREDIEDIRFVYGNLNDRWSGPPDRPASDHVRYTSPMFDDDGPLASAGLKIRNGCKFMTQMKVVDV